MTLRKIFFLILGLAAILLVPYWGASFAHDFKFPCGYFDFPPQGHHKPDANTKSLGVAVVVTIAVLLLYFFPRLFGFKKSKESKPQRSKGHKLPVWFWPAALIFCFTLVLWTGKFSEPMWFLNWSFFFLCWSFIVVLDSLVYYFNNGNSMLSKKPAELIAMGFVSVSGWLIFEWLNFFIEHNWYYPKAALRTHDGFIAYAVIGSSAFIPMSYQWYQLIRKFKNLDTKYRFGPKINTPTWLKAVLLILCFALLFITPFFPDNLFYFIWVAPVAILAIILSLLNIWTPFTPIKEKGDWTYILVFALTFLIQGFLLEGWNYLSGYKLPNGELYSYNAAYWMYCVPYVSKYPIFEMPLFGYLGYLLFSVHCSLWWITLGYLLGLDNAFSMQDDFK